MPKWVHDRAEHLMAKNPTMPKSMAFAIATQQGKAAGAVDKPEKSPETAKVGSVLIALLPKLGFAYSAYGGQPAENPPGMKSRSPIPGFVAPALEVKEAAKVGPIARVGELLTGSRRDVLHNAAAKHVQDAYAARSTALRAAHAADAVHHTMQAAPGIFQGPGAIHPMDAYEHLRGKSTKAVGSLRHQVRAANKLDDLARREARKVHNAQNVAGATMTLAPAVLAPAIVVGATLHKYRRLAAEKAKRRETRKTAGIGVGAGMSTSQYSGPLSYGPFKQTSGIPGFVAPGMTQTRPDLEAPAYAVGGTKEASPAEVMMALGGITKGFSAGRNAAGETAAALAPAGRVTRSDNIARTLAVGGAPAGSVAALALAHRLHAADLLAQAASRRFPGGVVGNPAVDNAIIRLALPLVAATAGGVVGGHLTGLGVGAVQRLRGPLRETRKEAAATGAMSPAGKLQASQRVGAPKTTGFSGPSIAEIAKPKGYGRPLAGATKNGI